MYEFSVVVQSYTVRSLWHPGFWMITHFASWIGVNILSELSRDKAKRFTLTSMFSANKPMDLSIAFQNIIPVQSI